MVKERDFGLITGNDAKINGYKEITVTTDENIVLDQSGTEVKVKLNTNNFQAPITGTPGKMASFDDNGNIISVDPIAINPDAAIHPNIELYGFIINMNESNPNSMITYINDNRLYSPAKMEWIWISSSGGSIYTETERFTYGDWANAFFIKNLRPCMLRYNGNVAYDLDKNDYSKKADGTASDISNESFAGNAMVGIPTVWIKVDDLGSGEYKVQLSNYRLDSNFHAYAHHDNNGNIMPYTYIGAYEGWVDSSDRLRSLSGQSIPENSPSATSLTRKARANNPSGTDIWDIEKFVDHNLINILLMLISKTTNTQAAFGYGNGSGQVDPASGANPIGSLPTGTLNSKGLFFGEIDSSDSVGKLNLAMKVFGIENWWGNIHKIVMGLVYPGSSDGTRQLYYKLTNGTEDGSTVNGFDINSLDDNNGPTGWINSGIKLNSGWISSLTISSDGCILPSAVGASSSTYFCDYATSYSRNGMISFGGMCGNIQNVYPIGAFCLYNIPLSSVMASYITATLSCKPTVAT